MNKEKIIKMAFLELGFPYADEDLQEDANFSTASFYFDTVILGLQEDTRFGFNYAEEKLKLLDRQTYPKRYEYAKPTNYLKNMTPGLTEYQDRLVSEDECLLCVYLKKIDLEDIPDSYERLAVLSLALAIAPSVGKVKAMQRIAQLLITEEDRMTAEHGQTVWDMEDLR